ncbi:hypothetical protein Gpo141_00014116, partial [Globisporangium polare]
MGAAQRGLGPLGALFVTVLTANVAQFVAAQTCTSAAANTLASTCLSPCSTGQLCAKSTLTASGCSCYSAPIGGLLSFLIVFNTTTAAKFQAGSSTPSDIISETYIISGSSVQVSNDIISKVDQLELVPAATRVYIHGGSTTSGRVGVKGVVAAIEIAEKFLSGQNQVTEVMLMSVSLGASINTIATNLPPNLRSLNLDNTLLNEFPSGVTKLKALQFLCVVL